MIIHKGVKRTLRTFLTPNDDDNDGAKAWVDDAQCDASTTATLENATIMVDLQGLFEKTKVLDNPLPKLVVPAQHAANNNNYLLQKMIGQCWCVGDVVVLESWMMAVISLSFLG